MINKLLDILPEGITLQLYLAPNGTDRTSGKILFSSSKKWLHPLFELEEFLAKHAVSGSAGGCSFEFDGGLKASASEFILRDRVIGRAAAFFVVRMGIPSVKTDLVSRRALPLLKEHTVAVDGLRTVDAVNCMTEDLLKDISDADQAYSLLSARRAEALEKLKVRRALYAI